MIHKKKLQKLCVSKVEENASALGSQGLIKSHFERTVRDDKKKKVREPSAKATKNLLGITPSKFSEQNGERADQRQSNALTGKNQRTKDVRAKVSASGRPYFSFPRAIERIKKTIFRATIRAFCKPSSSASISPFAPPNPLFQ